MQDSNNKIDCAVFRNTLPKFSSEDLWNLGEVKCTIGLGRTVVISWYNDLSWWFETAMIQKRNTFVRQAGRTVSFVKKKIAHLCMFCSNMQILSYFYLTWLIVQQI
jgi:hypothetical protein